MESVSGQAYRSPAGELMIFVRHEERNGVGGRVLAGAQKRHVYTRWFADGDEIPGELVHDTDGRAEAVAERIYAEQVERERDALAEVMKQAARWLSSSQVDELRRLYFKERDA